MLRHLALVLDEDFGGSHNLGAEPKYFVERLAGGASRASPAVVAQLRQELERAAKAAEEQAFAVLGVVTNDMTLTVEAVDDGETKTMPAESPELPEGDGVRANPAFGQRGPSRAPFG